MGDTDAVGQTDAKDYDINEEDSYVTTNGDTSLNIFPKF